MSEVISNVPKRLLRHHQDSTQFAIFKHHCETLAVAMIIDYHHAAQVVRLVSPRSGRVVVFA